MKKIKTKNILVTVGIVILLAVIVYVRSRISPLFGNYSVEKNEKKVEAKPTMDTKSQETKKSQGKTETLSTGINSYWNMQGSGKVKFDASAGFYDEWGDIPALEYKTKMNFIKIAKLKKGILYHLKIEQASDLKIPTKRLSLGYFYVQKNRIMRIWENNDYEAQGNVWTLSKKTLNRIIKTSEIPKYSTIVWQKKTYKDKLLTVQEYFMLKNKYQAALAELEVARKEKELLLNKMQETYGEDLELSHAAEKYFGQMVVTKDMVDALIERIEVFAKGRIHIIFRFEDEYRSLLEKRADMEQEGAN